ncbi:MAG: DUF2088 domain-containing protein [Actinomycetota bacterium]|nr:DUF2088 domain-containing protein [Actinomycetota bacterium]
MTPVMRAGLQLGPLPTPYADRGKPPLPRVMPVRQRFATPRVGDVAAAVRAALAPLAGRVRRGEKVALTAGSRGIHDLVITLRTAGAVLRELGAEPFVVPAMGSHGGATAEGQIAVLAHLGVSEESVAMQIRATMETVVVDQIPDGPTVYLDANAAAADRILVVNRVKPHTQFHGMVESGISKMLAIGLGKRRGAEGIHAYGPSGLARYIPEIARRVVATNKVLGGLALVENAVDETARVVLLEPADIAAARESELLAEAGRLMGRLPFDDLDVVVVDEMGKNYSGSGMDPNVLGRLDLGHGAPPQLPDIRVVAVLSLSEVSDGNGCGVGQADFASRRLVEAIDLQTTYINILTSGLGGIRHGAIPVTLENDEETIAAAIHRCGVPSAEAARLVRIHDTAHLEQLLVSESLAEEAAKHAHLEVLGDPAPLGFDDHGNVADFAAAFS